MAPAKMFTIYLVYKTWGWFAPYKNIIYYQYSIRDIYAAITIGIALQ
jgi:hypothetical protein